MCKWVQKGFLALISPSTFISAKDFAITSKLFFIVPKLSYKEPQVNFTNFNWSLLALLLFSTFYFFLCRFSPLLPPSVLLVREKVYQWLYVMVKKDLIWPELWNPQNRDHPLRIHLRYYIRPVCTWKVPGGEFYSISGIRAALLHISNKTANSLAPHWILSIY